MPMLTRWHTASSIFALFDRGFRSRKGKISSLDAYKLEQLFCCFKHSGDQKNDLGIAGAIFDVAYKLRKPLISPNRFVTMGVAIDFSAM